MAPEARHDQPVHPLAPLGLGIDIKGGVGTLTLSEWALPALGRLERLCMDVPDLRFPFRLSNGVSGFRNRRCRLRALQISIGPTDVQRFVDQIPLADSGFERLTVELTPQGFSIAGRIQLGGPGADFFATGVFQIAPPQGVRLVFSDLRTHGFVPVAAPTLMTATLAVLAGRFDPQTWADPSAVLASLPRWARMAGPTEAQIDVLELVLFSLLVPRGWRLPARDHMALAPLRYDGDRLVIDFCPQDEDAGRDKEPQDRASLVDP